MYTALLVHVCLFLVAVFSVILVQPLQDVSYEVSPWYCLILQLLSLDKIKVEPVTLIMRDSNIRARINRRGTVARRHDNTKWLVFSLFVY
jgi:hypothetical protein